MIGFVECAELAVVDETWRNAANAGKGDYLVRSLGAGAVQGVFVLQFGATEIKEYALERFGMLPEWLAPVFLDHVGRDQALQIVTLDLVEAAKVECILVVAFSRLLGERLAAFFSA